jgi:hypothetical protein
MGSRLLANGTRLAWSIVTSYYDSSYFKGVDYNLSWEKIFKGQFGGLVMSKIYNGIWDTEEFWKKRLSVSDQSIVNVTRQRKVDLFNASSLSSWELIRILRNREAKRKRPINHSVTLKPCKTQDFIELNYVNNKLTKESDRFRHNPWNKGF